MANLARPKNNASLAGGRGANVAALSQSSFFAYDDKQVKRGLRDFKRKWGNRSIDDDWRRSAKASFNVGEEELIDESGAIVDVQISDDEISNVLSEVPSTPEQINVANNKIMNAMFALGKAFRDKLEDNKQAITTLEDMAR